MLRIITSSTWGFARLGHPESAGRLEAIRPILEKYPQELLESPHPNVLRHTAEVHSERMVRRAELRSAESGDLDPDTPTSPATWRAALLAQTAALLAVEEAAREPGLRLFLPTRPPGHHATRQQSMGFCLFNHIALAAHHAAAHCALSPVLVVDFDVHHGNGTQDIFYTRGDVFYFSMHQYPLYPGTGLAHERGEGEGEGWTRNLPVPPGTPRRQQMAFFKEVLGEVSASARPRLVLVSAGFDAHRADPLANLLLEAEDFGEMTREIVAVADKYADGRIISFLEGGYDPAALRESVETHLAALAGD
ncbi:histone deacetylase [bacterium]|nr:histone deacetylase [bacterium]